jgi:hypothetical protein
MYVRAFDALYLAGDGERAGVVAEEAYRRFSGHVDPATAAIVCHCPDSQVNRHLCATRAVKLWYAWS